MRSTEVCVSEASESWKWRQWRAPTRRGTEGWAGDRRWTAALNTSGGHGAIFGRWRTKGKSHVRGRGRRFGPDLKTSYDNLMSRELAAILFITRGGLGSRDWRLI